MRNLCEINDEFPYRTGTVGNGQDDSFILALRNAIQNDQLTVQYQPRYDTNGGQTKIFEALVRWPNSTHTLYPDSFIELAVTHGLIYSLDLNVFKKCCNDLKWFRRIIDSNIKIAVNISPLECESLHHTQKLIYICEASGLSMSDFEFEITECSHISDNRKVKAFCDIMIDHGASISLDDFGTCFSPLSNLCELPVSYIKIDKNFTDKIGYGGRSEILIGHLIKLAHEMNIKVVAEGIEHAYQRDHLVDMGCDQLQGFYMCRPMAADSITDAHMKM